MSEQDSKKRRRTGRLKALGEIVRASLKARAYQPITVAELRQRIDSGSPLTIVDCRTPREFADGHIDGALNVSYRVFMDRHAEIPTDRPIVTVCYVGIYSRAAAQKLAESGHCQIHSLIGGMKAWNAAHGIDDDE